MSTHETQQNRPENQNLMDTKIVRRSFLRTTLGAGFAASTFPAILTGCGSQQTRLEWVSSSTSNNSATFKFLVELYNSINSDHIQVKLISPDEYTLPNQIDAQYSYATGILKAKKPQPDIFSLDIVWMKEFASRGWIYPLDQYWRDAYQSDNYLRQIKRTYLNKPFDAVYFAAAEHLPTQIWGAPHHTDAGIFYSRTDMPVFVNSTPARQWAWSDIIQMCQNIKNAGTELPWRFAWQGSNTEGLVCNFVEVLDGYGAQLFDDPMNPKRVTINTPGAIMALQQMLDSLNISTESLLTDTETESAEQWLQGHASFMRNWPGVVADSSKSTSPVTEKFQITALPFGPKGPSRSCLGGWQLAINNFSPNKDQAWKFIYWLLQADAQQYLAVKEAFPVTLQAVYQNEYVQQQQRFYTSLRAIIEDAQFRPMTPHYQTCVSMAIRNCVYTALTSAQHSSSCYTAAMAIADLERELNRILQLRPSATCIPSPDMITMKCQW